jgi:hypothetical protein
VGGKSFGLISIVPKDQRGQPVADLSTMLIDLDPAAPDRQELKEWLALYLRDLPPDARGLPNLPDRYAQPEGRQGLPASTYLIDLVRQAGSTTLIALGLGGGLVVVGGRSS